jgi:ABC-2 type transport system ATP-binding protein
MIEVNQLTKQYGATQAVGGISFRVDPGEVVGLLGPNGAGKSTTLRILTGYLPPTSGDVKMGGIDVQADPLEARRRIGYLSEINPLYESLGVWECLDLFGRLRGLSGDLLRRRIGESAEACALRDVMAKDVGELSKGYRQRLGLALAILHDPQILILDEPTSALDPNQQRDVRDLILRLKEKKTVLLSTHILPDAQRVCDRILIIHKGTIVAQGTMDELQQRLTGGHTFYVRLKGPTDQVAPRLSSLPGVTSVQYQDEREPGCPGFLVDSTEDPRESIGRWAAETGFPLMELHRPTAALDDIFRQFTETK